MTERQLKGKIPQQHQHAQYHVQQMERIDIVVGTATEFGDMFQDPRQPSDRRRRSEPDKIPESGCRRRAERRTMVYMNSDDWWMKRNYNNNADER